MIFLKVLRIFINRFNSFVSVCDLWFLLGKNRTMVNFASLKIRGKSNFSIHKDSFISFGKNLRINNGYLNNPIGRQIRTLIVVKKGGELILGNNIGISSSCIVCTSSISIGDNTLIGGDVCIYDTDFHSLDFALRNTPEDNHNVVSKPISIGRNVFIGAHVIILKGVTIGDNSIIGAGSVVSKDVPENQIWVGNPAKFVKFVSNEI
ncbi:acyltransferase [Algoriphagus formosus]|uniref:Acyltransferase n=1 Tax=Algoriphagus formosus TaxID=2007308 RepID=A0A4R5USE8_9BACT|nr:DapH/DapD/GlmU-related protein [Algoriphagus aquimaris]TDK42040.1 acyltransferase [Algoriphagus aquimaris]